MEETSLVDSLSATSAASDPNHGWQKVTYPKRHRKQVAADPSTSGNQSAKNASSGNVFATVEQKANERHRAIQSMKAASVQPSSVPRGAGSDDDEDDEDAARAQENGDETAVKKPKQKKPKKPKVTVTEAAAGIDLNDLAAYIAEISVSYEDRQDIQLMRFADYFGRAFSSVSASQFPWFKIFKESPVAKILDMPLNHIPEPVYKTATDWVAQKSPEALGEFVIWSMDIILADLASHVAVAKGTKKATVQSTPTRSQVAMFAVLAMTLRRKPETLISILPKIKDNPKYQGQEKLPFIVWVIGQASLGDLAVGTYLWARYLFPTICGKLSGNPQSRDLVLQVIERVLSSPKAKSILSNSAVRKGERLVPPSSFDLLMRATFPPPPSRVKATERYEAVYPILKEVALAGTPGTKTTKQASHQLLPYCVKAMQENNPELTKEASGVFFWCLSQNTECYKQWDEHHMGNLDASVVVLRKLASEWKELSPKLSPDALRETVANIKAKTEEALDETTDPAKLAVLKETDKLCKSILGKLSRGFSCLKGGVVVILLASVAAGFALSPNADSYNWDKLRAMFTSSTQSFYK
ncbi:Transmembrane protein 214-A [Carex littledalei]|uniref:Transmembrane protein 214-A n=1 Tax=Carex littledalei TaxID=544730 RepID=A0A833QYN6_9POAL|nr:Transmembrane protein 214-A [Carex littledalei]